jgi:hypothetical protein
VSRSSRQRACAVSQLTPRSLPQALPLPPPILVDAVRATALHAHGSSRARVSKPASTMPSNRVSDKPVAGPSKSSSAARPAGSGQRYLGNLAHAAASPGQAAAPAAATTRAGTHTATTAAAATATTTATTASAASGHQLEASGAVLFIEQVERCKTDVSHLLLIENEAMLGPAVVGLRGISDG